MQILGGRARKTATTALAACALCATGCWEPLWHTSEPSYPSPTLVARNDFASSLKQLGAWLEFARVGPASDDMTDLRTPLLLLASAITYVPCVPNIVVDEAAGRVRDAARDDALDEQEATAAAVKSALASAAAVLEMAAARNACPAPVFRDRVEASAREVAAIDEDQPLADQQEQVRASLAALDLALVTILQCPRPANTCAPLASAVHEHDLAWHARPDTRRVSLTGTLALRPPPSKARQ